MPEAVCRDCQSLSISGAGILSRETEGERERTHTKPVAPELQLHWTGCDSPKVTGQYVSSQCRQDSVLAEDQCCYWVREGRRISAVSWP